MNVRWIIPDDSQRLLSFHSASDNTERNLPPTVCKIEFASRALRVLSVLHRLYVVQIKTEPREFGMKLWLIVRGKRGFECRLFLIKPIELTRRKIKFNYYHKSTWKWRNSEEIVMKRKIRKKEVNRRIIKKLKTCRQSVIKWRRHIRFEISQPLEQQ